MCCLYSTMALYPKTEVKKPLSHGKKIIFEVIFPMFLCYKVKSPVLELHHPAILDGGQFLI